MTESDFRPMEKTLTELVKFMESQEEADLEGGRNRETMEAINVRRPATTATVLDAVTRPPVCGVTII